MPSSRVIYAGGLDALGVDGPPGLLERGEENVRIGRGRTGRTKEVVELEDEDEDRTDAFRLRSAKDGLCVGSSGEGVGGSTVIITERIKTSKGRSRPREGRREKGKGREKRRMEVEVLNGDRVIASRDTPGN